MQLQEGLLWHWAALDKLWQYVTSSKLLWSHWTLFLQTKIHHWLTNLHHPGHCWDFISGVGACVFSHAHRLCRLMVQTVPSPLRFNLEKADQKFSIAGIGKFLYRRDLFLILSSLTWAVQPCWLTWSLYLQLEVDWCLNNFLWLLNLDPYL